MDPTTAPPTTPPAVTSVPVFVTGVDGSVLAPVVGGLVLVVVALFALVVASLRR